jgi:hypothetical protein
VILRRVCKKVKMSLGEGPEPKRRKWRMYDQRLSNIVNDFDDYDPMDLYTVKPRFTGPHGGKGNGPVNRGTRSIGGRKKNRPKFGLLEV